MEADDLKSSQARLYLKGTPTFSDYRVSEAAKSGHTPNK
jgi:hypothetical protein